MGRRRKNQGKFFVAAFVFLLAIVVSCPVYALGGKGYKKR